MAFKKNHETRRKLKLIALIDLVFILLIFFIVTSLIVKLAEGESKLAVPTPKNEEGVAQVLIQITEDGYVWIDDTARNIMAQDYLDSPGSVRNRIARIIADGTVSSIEVMDRLTSLYQRADRNRAKIFNVIVRCPDDAPYWRVINLLERLQGGRKLENLNYGLLGGTIEDIRNSDPQLQEYPIDGATYHAVRLNLNNNH